MMLSGVGFMACRGKPKSVPEHDIRFSRIGINGPEKFRSSAEKDFCNTIRPEADLALGRVGAFLFAPSKGRISYAILIIADGAAMAIERGWLVLNDSGTCVKFTQWGCGSIRLTKVQSVDQHALIAVSAFASVVRTDDLAHVLGVEHRRKAR